MQLRLVTWLYVFVLHPLDYSEFDHVTLEALELDPDTAETGLVTPVRGLFSVGRITNIGPCQELASPSCCSPASCPFRRPCCRLCHPMWRCRCHFSMKWN